MPPRPIVFAVLGFWLAANGWLFYREIWPRLRAGEAPAYSIDLAEEVAAEPISWDVLYNKKRVGLALTRVVFDAPSRSYDLVCEYSYDKGLPVMALLDIRKMTSTMRVNRQGELKAAHVDVKLRGFTGPAEMKLDLDIDQGKLTPRLEVRAGAGLLEQKLKLDPVDVSAGGSILNPMHPLNKVKGLREGMNWRLPDVDPLKAAAAAVINQVPGQQFTFPSLFAEVRATSLNWAGQPVECWVIEYREAGQKVSARTYVRRSDDRVLQQEALHQGNHLVLQRDFFNKK
jgi:hypothetical protein